MPDKSSVNCSKNNLTRAAGVLAGGTFAKARTATVCRKPIHVPARIAHSARKIRFRLPLDWPWQSAWERLFTIVHAPPPNKPRKPSASRHEGRVRLDGLYPARFLVEETSGSSKNPWEGRFRRFRVRQRYRTSKWCSSCWVHKRFGKMTISRQP